MITPTFAAGLGVVVAAGLTFDMPRAVLHFGVPDGTPCAVTGCGATPVPGRGGVLASAKPGVHLAAPATHGSAASGGGPAAHSPSSGHAGHDQVRVAYAKTQQWPWGFADQITISGLAEGQGSWRLAFGYPGTSILEVSGAQWQPNGPDAGVATGPAPGGPQGGSHDGGPDGSGHPGGGSVVITVTVSGSPAAPAGCRLDDAPCSFR